MGTATIDLSTVTLYPGSHRPDEGKRCIMEVVSLLAGEPFGHSPACACRAITRYVVPLNDRMPHDQRQRLLAYATRIAGSKAGLDVERARQYLAESWAVKVFVPLALDARGRTDTAAKLRALPDITDRASNIVAKRAIQAACAIATAYPAEIDVVSAVFAAAAAAADPARAAAVWDAALACLDALLAVGVGGPRVVAAGREGDDGEVVG